jgi:hypothetical protein
MMTSTLEKFEDNKRQSEAIMKDRQYSGQRKRTQNVQQNITQRSKDRETRTPLTTDDAPKCFVRVVISCSIFGTRHLSIKGY